MRNFWESLDTKLGGAAGSTTEVLISGSFRGILLKVPMLSSEVAELKFVELTTLLSHKHSIVLKKVQ